MRTMAMAASLALSAALSAAATDHEWNNLFNGEDLTGWVASGSSDAWSVRDGEIVIVQPGRGGWLRTDRMYRDFELKLDFWMPERGNSGVGLRGSSGGDPAFSGFEVQILDTHGEDPNVRNCGSIYEAVPPAEMAVYPHGRWNTYRIRLVGDVLDVWLNGRQIHKATRLDDRGFYRREDQPLPLNARATTGYIALQDHGEPFRFRNLRIRDLSPDPEPVGMVHLVTRMGQGGVPEGWFSEDSGTWTIENGALVGRGGPGHLFTQAAYRDFELRALVRVNERGNSGIYFRTRPNPAANNPWPIGPEAQIDNHDPRNFTGVIYNQAWPVYINAPITRDNAWFDYRIRAEGGRVRTWINGIQMVDVFMDEPTAGHIALQGHHEGNEIMFRDLRIIELD
ncbi:MAG: DUF1080 domain-containing protein [Phycisphaerales bacterium]|nr:DUF1080 domain-containing protein [Planctomycetota bacterium]MCH8508697.1 DUF1080 domain-containing protein [Phycisphaerales bacterium]